MKRVKDLPYFKKIREVREFEFGVFYYFDGLVISEIKEGVVFDWNMAKRAVAAAKEIFGEETPIAYISNRINSYTVVPTEWLKFKRTDINCPITVWWVSHKVVLRASFWRKCSSRNHYGKLKIWKPPLR